MKEMPTFMLALPPYGNNTQGIEMITYCAKARVTAGQAIDLLFAQALLNAGL